MPKPLLTLVDGQAVAAADMPLADLLESALIAAEALQAATLTRASFWTRIFDGAARGNGLARHLAEGEALWLTGQEGRIAVLHSALSQMALRVRAEGRDR